MPTYLPRLLERLEPLLGSPKMGPMLWQLPESFHRDDERLAEALAGVRAVPQRDRVPPSELVLPPRCSSSCASTASGS